MDNIYDHINKLYTKGSYLDRYGGDLLLVGTICAIIACVVSYYYIRANLQPILEDWPNQRCQPMIIPFAGWINSDSGKGALEYTGENFSGCIQTILADITGYAFMPVYYVMSTITNLFTELEESMQAARSFFDTTRNNVKDVGTDLMGRGLNITLPVISIMQYVKDIIGKVVGSMTSALYMLIGGYITTVGLFDFVMELVLNLILIIVGIITLCFAIGWFAPTFLTYGIMLTVFLTILMIPLLIMQVIMSDIMDATRKPPPPPPPKYCFSADTQVAMESGKSKPIREVMVGDVLSDGAVVTARMVSSSAEVPMYNLDGACVSGGHRVFYPITGWIDARDHPRATLVEDFREPYIYCLGTNVKTIKVGELMYADWDEIDEGDMVQLRAHMGRDLDACPPKGFQTTDIHRYLDTGIHGNTKIVLEDGSIMDARDIAVNDVLQFGEVVKSVIEIDGTDIASHFRYYAGDQYMLSGSGNLSIDASNLGEGMEVAREAIKGPVKLYSLVTSTGSFHVNGARVGDYNRGIDRYLSEQGGLVKKATR
jgi:hypothetical protein